MTEDRGQKTEDRRQKTDDRGQMTEDPSSLFELRRGTQSAQGMVRRAESTGQRID